MTSVCAYLRVGGEFDVCVVVVGDDGVFCVVVRVGLVSIIDEIVRVFPTSAEQTCRHDKMRHFLREEACFKRNHFV